MKRLLLGGFGMQTKHLFKYKFNTNIQTYVHHPFVLGNVWLHPIYQKRIKQTIMESKESVCIHLFSSSTWITTKLLNDPDVKDKIHGLIMDSPAYLFREEIFIKAMLEQNKTMKFLNHLPLISWLDIYLNTTGGTLEWRENFKRTLEQIKIPTLILHSKNDHLIPYHDSVTLNSHLKNSELKLFEHGSHCQLIRYYPDEYASLVKTFVKNI